MGAGPDHRASTLEGQVARVADIIAYVKHDIDDAVRAGILGLEELPSNLVSVLGSTSSERIGCMVTDVVSQTLNRSSGVDVDMSDEVLQATLDLRAFLFDAVYENDEATAEFKKAYGILSGLWDKVRETPEYFLDHLTLARDGLDVAA